MATIDHFGHFIVRSPLFPYDGIHPAAAHSLDEWLDAQLENDLFLEAVFWSSPVLYEQTVKMLQGDNRQRERVRISLKKYLIRASSRCTPFGLFAGCSLGTITGWRGEPVLAAAAGSLRKAIRMDMHLLFTLSSLISRDPALVPLLSYHPNNSLYQVGDTYRYVEYELEQGVRSYRLSSVEREELLARIFAAAAGGARFQEVVALIDLEALQEEKEQFVRELMEAQLLVSELELAVTDPDPLGSLIRKLQTLAAKVCQPRLTLYLEVLTGFEGAIARLNERSDRARREEMVALFKEGLKQLGLEDYRSSFFQLDLYKETPTPDRLPGETLSAVLKGIEVLSRFTATQTKQERQLAAFKRAFVEKYESEEVPLAEVIDSETGISFPVLGSIGNISDAALADAYPEGNRTEQVTEPWHAFLQGRYERAVRLGETEIVLQDGEIAGFAPKTGQLPQTFAAMFSLVAPGTGQQVFLQTVGGATANSLLGRFYHLDEGMYRLGREIAEKEQALCPDQILAEVLHLPEARVGNVLQRPVLRAYEIPYLSAASVPGERQLPVADLLVRVEGDRIVLRSKRLGKQVRPRLSTAHNYAQRSLPLYHFLCAMQHEGKTALGVDWGSWASGLTFLPRLTYRNVILAPATWKFSAADTRQLLESGLAAEPLAAFWKQWNLPPTVAITRGDHQLLIHIHRPEYREILLQELKDQKSLHLTEWLHVGDVAAPGSFLHQVVLPLYQPAPRASGPPPVYGEDARALRRTFFPGDEWLYVKIYCGAHVADTVLAEAVKPVVERLEAAGEISQYFFIRYTDPHCHLRLRMQLGKGEGRFAWALGELNAALAAFTAQRLVWKVQLDTYVREVERYSPRYMLSSERLFYHDSALFLAAAGQLELDGEGDRRLLYAMRNVASWLDTFQLDLAERLDFIRGACAALGKEFKPDLRVTLDQQYRALRHKVTAPEEHDALEGLLALRSRRIADELGHDIAGKDAALFRNLGSYIHMSINRWFKTDQRLQEYVVYYFLQKHYTEKRKRAAVLQEEDR
ncbi:lantibiotic dehydratase [Pontibacter indicus]|uniref:Thiopeptide-type bacteriocin biosynthesis domain-containing protein n=1 Tax=Pontibacter indicus TaxID=1317125 RepID=A0A1R3XPW9_9BACT|nr:lantibiotic dehydratase [Pontibacter indicus]SIT93969.1 thiopeptide-type bacteriocin biosynthesis domain-containing protein [Pontibacter indicus]